uniref:Steryl-sulfatase-like n=1 Tax=Dermatophagoides pteronyssinus TaxID=6956 RepID=A0A6P6XYN6_DERPT|nr:steryl-sulfatase-like [Dermatophagoides pteronyssinus]
MIRNYHQKCVLRSIFQQIQVMIIWSIMFAIVFVVDDNVRCNQNVVVNSRPNFLIMVADDMGYGDVSLLGNHSLPTPNIDRIGREGMILNQHLTAASVCTPSRSAFLTGRYPIRNGMTAAGKNRVFLFVASSGGLPPEELTIAKLLKQQIGNEYRTALIGKWHLGKDCSKLDDNCHHPNQHGFDYFFGIPLTNLKDFGDDGQSVVISYYPHFYLLLTMIGLLGSTLGLMIIIRFQKSWLKSSILIILISIILPAFTIIFQKNISILNGVLYRNDQLIEQPIHLKGITKRLTDESEQFIRNTIAQNQSFFVILNFIKVHTALVPSEKFEGKSRYGKYGDCVLELDDGVGRMLDLLEELEIVNKTFTYFTSDNGAHLEEVDLNGNPEGGSNGIYRGGKGHGAMEGGIRVPTFLRWPNVLPKNLTKISQATSQMDLFPTISAILNLTLPTDRILDGRNIFPLLTGENHTSPHNFLFHYCGIYLHGVRYIEDNDHVWKVYFYQPKYKPQEDKCLFVCMCHGKLVVKHDPPLIYNIAQDPTEINPIVDSKIRSKILRKVTKAVQQHRLSLNTNIESQFSFGNSIWKPWLQPCCSWKFCHC